ncbi:MAG TPA: AbrB/MazE/SpoVT family DNA-binding domain-containing protein [Pyrinomonadaceae bacterium]|nr:AbrB/MazE/SpoVT family DNA-binding domain-containing protein [Pyrinomonadaceae bacterium]
MKTLSELTVKTKVTEGGRIVIPAKLRKALGIEIGENVTIEIQNNSLHILSRKETLRRVKDSVRKYAKPETSAVDELIKERREESANE